LDDGEDDAKAGHLSRLSVHPVYRLTRFESGPTVATAEMPQMSGVSIGLWVGIGSRYEPANLNGVCHFIEHLLFKGTRCRSAKEISEAVEGVGGYLNAFTSEETTCYHARAGHDRFEQVLDVLMDMYLNSKFAPLDVGKEREVIKEEIAMYMDQPHHQVQELLNATLWPGQPLGRPITGTERTLDGLERSDLVNYWREFYGGQNLLIVAAGQIKHRRVVRAVRPYVRKLKPGRQPRFTAASNGQESPCVRLFTKPTEQTQLALGIRACSRHDPRRYALRLLNTIVGENMSSRLFQVVREERGLAYSIYSTSTFFGDTGDLVISAGLEEDKLGKTLRLILHELRRLTEVPPGQAELRRARDYILGQLDLHLESTESHMIWVGEQLLGYGKVLTASEMKRRFRVVTPGQIRSIARDLFRPERMNLALVSPLKSDREVVRLLRSF